MPWSDVLTCFNLYTLNGIKFSGYCMTKLRLAEKRKKNNFFFHILLSQVLGAHLFLFQLQLVVLFPLVLCLFPSLLILSTSDLNSQVGEVGEVG